MILQIKFFLLISMMLLGCVTAKEKHCLLGQNTFHGDGVTAYPDDFATVLPKRPVGARRCAQSLNAWGHWINDGMYTEFDAQDQLRLRGFYSKGLRHGRFEFFNVRSEIIAVDFYNYGHKVDSIEKVENAYFFTNPR